MPLAKSVSDILEPYVGKMVADTCVRATALSMGKTSDALDRDDLPRLEESVRKLLGPVAPKSTIESLIIEMERSAT